MEIGHHTPVAEAACDVDVYIRICELSHDILIDEVGDGECIVNGSHVVIVAIEHRAGDSPCLMAEGIVMLRYIIDLKVVDAFLDKSRCDFRFRCTKLCQLFAFFFGEARTPGGIERKNDLRDGRVHDDLRRFGVCIEIKFSRRTGVRSAVSAAHDDELLDLSCDLRLYTKSHRKIRQRADGCDIDISFRLHQRLHEIEDGMFLLCPDLGFGEREKIAVTVIERHARKAWLSPRDLIADDRFLTSAIDRNACFHELHHTQRILRGLWHDAVPIHRSHADEVDGVRFHRQHHGNGIIRAGIAVKNHFLRNHSRIPPVKEIIGIGFNGSGFTRGLWMKVLLE